MLRTDSFKKKRRELLLLNKIKTINKEVEVWCQCTCGRKIWVKRNLVLKGLVNDCGCSKK